MSTKENDNREESKQPNYNDDKDQLEEEQVKELENQNKRQQIIFFGSVVCSLY